MAPFSEFNFFEFERDFVTSLRCIPMQVRYKLDSCGVKLKLDHWNRFSPEQKQTLVEQPCGNAAAAAAYRQQLQAWVITQTGRPAKVLEIDPAPPWGDGGAIPAELLVQVQAHHLSLSLAQWAGLSPLQRFVLLKLSRPSHENRNFVPAMVEFGLA
jgi:hypothetical protein